MTLRDVIERAVDEGQSQCPTASGSCVHWIAACTRAVREALEMAAGIPADYARYYPADLFPAEGCSKDAIAATALRKVLPNVAADIRTLAAELEVKP